MGCQAGGVWSLSWILAWTPVFLSHGCCMAMYIQGMPSRGAREMGRNAALAPSQTRRHHSCPAIELASTRGLWIWAWGWCCYRMEAQGIPRVELRRSAYQCWHSSAALRTCFRDDASNLGTARVPPVVAANRHTRLPGQARASACESHEMLAEGPCQTSLVWARQ